MVDPLLTDFLILCAAAGLDYAIGDPWAWPHPVQGMGWVIERSQSLILHLAPGWPRKLGGVVLGLGLIGGCGGLGWAIPVWGARLHPVFGAIAQVILLASCFAARGLRWAALDVLEPLAAGDLDQARHQLSRYVGRDTDQLDAGEIRRAVLETIAENTTDGVTAPLFYAIAGLWLGIGPLPLAIAYKAASTLDSMIGYRRDPFHDLGWFSAQLEDRLTWLPCRLTVLLIALLSRHPRHVLTLCRRDAPQDPSPNSGWSECAYAAALGVQVGGLNTYRGELRPKPLLGEPLRPITPAVIDQGLAWMRSLFLWELAIGGVGVLLQLALSLRSAP